jgi:membrane protein implicated in regulation of membrane protease activity
MDPKTRNSAIAAALILGGFGLAAFFMPTIMLALGEISPLLAGFVAIAFVLAFFGVFWLRARNKRED